MTERPDALHDSGDAIAMLTVDHQTINMLFASYTSAGDSSTKQHIAAQMFVELHIHTQLEEQIFYPAYEAMAGKDGTRLAADSRLAHAHVRALMIELRGIDGAEAEFEAKFSELMRTVQDHVAEEEHEMFPEAAVILADRLAVLMDDMVTLKQQLTTAPRP